MAVDMGDVLFDEVGKEPFYYQVDVPPPFILGISGKRQSGKDSVAKMLNLELTPIDSDYTAVMLMSFAAPLKAIAKDLYFWDGQKDPIGRWLLQKLGTEKVRSVSSDYWVDLARRRLKDALAARVIPPIIVCFVDVRFPNEVDFIKSENGEVWRVERIGYEDDVKSGESLDKHLSEIALDDYKDWDAVLAAKDLDGLYEQVKQQLDRLRAEGKVPG